MNKLTPRLLRDLHSTLPEGTECYLCDVVRKALVKYRKGYETKAFLNKEQALSVLSQKLGRGLYRFLNKEFAEKLAKRQIFNLKNFTATETA